MKNELEMVIQAARKAVTEQSKVSKGVKYKDDKISYVEAMKGIDKLEDFFRSRGALSIGTCGSCSNFTIMGHQSKYQQFGTCEVHKKSVHCYDCCPLLKVDNG